MKPHSKTDWERVKREANAPVVFDPTVDPYNPNDESAVEAYWEGVLIKSAGVVVGRVRGKGKRPVKEQVACAVQAQQKCWRTFVHRALAGKHA